jgi:uncharacterized protein
MLRVDTRVDRSALHGLGLFAAAPIAQGTEVWRFTPGFDLDVDVTVFDRQPASFRERLLHYGYVDRRLNRFILCCDDARFINHSETPNIYPDFTLEPHGVDLAVRDIAIGEEITIDYRRLESRFDRAPRRTKSSSDLSGGPRDPPLSDSTPGGQCSP